MRDPKVRLRGLSEIALLVNKGRLLTLWFSTTIEISHIGASHEESPSWIH